MRSSFIYADYITSYRVIARKRGYARYAREALRYARCLPATADASASLIRRQRAILSPFSLVCRDTLCDAFTPLCRLRLPRQQSRDMARSTQHIRMTIPRHGQEWHQRMLSHALRGWRARRYAMFIDVIFTRFTPPPVYADVIPHTRNTIIYDTPPTPLTRCLRCRCAADIC